MEFETLFAKISAGDEFIFLHEFRVDANVFEICDIICWMCDLIGCAGFRFLLFISIRLLY